MAKLIQVEEKDKNKSALIKVIISVICVLGLLVVAFIHSYMRVDEYEEDITDSLVCVHVKGAVAESGLYYVPFGTRVNDLEGYTGGFLTEADLDGVNLARVVKDGEEIYIPFKGSAENGGYNLNTISVDELIKKIEGIGETYANRIVEYRNSRGGFTKVSELKAIVGESVYEKVREKFYVE